MSCNVMFCFFSNRHDSIRAIQMHVHRITPLGDWIDQINDEYQVM